MDKKIISVKDLQCQYKHSLFPVLQIKELDLNEGEVVFFVGASGVGKSTLLETLGLMNNTISHRKDGLFHFLKDSSTDDYYDLKAIWNESETNLAKFRREYMSFIFQSTNLFSNLSAFENVLLNQAIEGGKTLELSKSRAEAMIRMLFPIVKDVEEIVDDSKAISKLSGGQKQRLAFVRAVLANFSVLFADEPTGNLDWWNAKNLIEILLKIVRDRNKLAVIVTHDIDLAINYGDRIILIDKEYRDQNDESSSFGVLGKEGVFRRTELGWSTFKEEQVNDEELSSYLRNQMKPRWI
mgnify:CR=1 FL=1|tara:strand:- start:1538 stop:2425 length:888 start_codon:yes stop_codon:yes gene_type:complete